jgi:hypothetical protein
MNVKFFVSVLWLNFVVNCVAIAVEEPEHLKLTSWPEELKFNSQACRTEGLSMIREHLALAVLVTCPTEDDMEAWRLFRKRFVKICF